MMRDDLVMRYQGVSIRATYQAYKCYTVLSLATN